MRHSRLCLIALSAEWFQSARRRTKGESYSDLMTPQVRSGKLASAGAFPELCCGRKAAPQLAGCHRADVGK